MRLSNPGALTAHTVAGDVTGDVRAPLAFGAQPHGADHFLKFTTIGDEPVRRRRAKLGAVVISDTGSWARQQPLNRERRQLPACGTAVHDPNAAQLALSVRADTITLVARAAGPRRDPKLMQEETPHAAYQVPSRPGRPPRVRSNLRLASPPGPGSGFAAMRGHPGRARHVFIEQGVAKRPDVTPGTQP